MPRMDSVAKRMDNTTINHEARTELCGKEVDAGKCKKASNVHDNDGRNWNCTA